MVLDGDLPCLGLGGAAFASVCVKRRVGKETYREIKD